MRAFLSAALALLALASCRPPGSGDGDASCADTARLGFPVDLSAFAEKGAVWPHGVHGGGHPEGHPGIDFILDQGNSDVIVTASLTSRIVAVQAESTVSGNSCIVLDSACVQVNLCHLRLDPGLRQGDTVRRGQRLGTVGPGERGGPLSLHFGAYMGHEAAQLCPAELLDPDTVRCLVGTAVGRAAPSDCGALAGRETMLGRSDYTESYPRSMTVTCADGGKEAFAVPAETSLCNPRLGDDDAARMRKCLGSSCAGIW